MRMVMSEIKRPQSLQRNPSSSMEFGPALDSSGGLDLATSTAWLALPAVKIGIASSKD